MKKIFIAILFAGVLFLSPGRVALAQTTDNSQLIQQIMTFLSTHPDFMTFLQSLFNHTNPLPPAPPTPCQSGDLFNFLTGQPCNSPGYPPGCTSSSGFSVITGQPCSTSTPPPTPVITVTSPSAGAYWREGETQTISWSAGGIDPTDRVQIDLLGTRYGLTRGQSLGTGGSVNIIVPTDIVPGQYQIKISDLNPSHLDYYGLSNYFLIAASTPPPPSTGSYNIYALGTSNGSVTISPFKALYAPGDRFTVTATPAAGYKLGAWTGNYASAVSPTVTVLNNLVAAGDYTFGATFIPGDSTPPPPTTGPYYIFTNPGNGGLITYSPTGAHQTGDSVTLTAQPNSGYTFTGWNGDASGTANPLGLIFGARNYTIGATFAAVSVGPPPTTSYNIYALGTSNGSVTISPLKALYAPGDLFTVTATPAAGYKLGAWTGNYPSIATVSPTITVLNMQAVGNYNFGATFILDTPPPPPPPANPVITVTSPSAGAYWRGGETQTISWSASGIDPTDRVQIDLLGTRYGLASGQSLGSGGSININVPRDIVPGSYQVKISDLNPSHLDFYGLSGYFLITGPTSFAPSQTQMANIYLAIRAFLQRFGR